MLEMQTNGRKRMHFEADSETKKLYVEKQLELPYPHLHDVRQLVRLRDARAEASIKTCPMLTQNKPVLSGVRSRSLPSPPLRALTFYDIITEQAVMIVVSLGLVSVGRGWWNVVLGNIALHGQRCAAWSLLFCPNSALQMVLGSIPAGHTTTSVWSLLRTLKL